MQVAQHFQIRAEQTGFAVSVLLPSDQHTVVHCKQRQQIIALPCCVGGARGQVQAAAHGIVEPASAVRHAGQMIGIAAQQQHRIEGAPARRRQVGKAHLAVDAAVAEGLGIQLLRQPAPPLGETIAAFVSRQFLLPVLQCSQQLLSCIVLLQTLVDTQHLQTLAQCSQPLRQGFLLVLFQQSGSLAQTSQGLMQDNLVFGQRAEFFQPGDYTLFAQQLFELVYRRLALAGRHVGKDERRFEQVEQINMVEITLQRGKPAVQHRAHRQRGEGPTCFVRHQYLGAFQQSAHTPRYHTVLRNDGDVALAGLQPQAHLHGGGARFLFEAGGGEEIQFACKCRDVLFTQTDRRVA